MSAAVSLDVIQRVSPPDWFGSGRGLRYYWPLADAAAERYGAAGVVNASLVVRHDPTRKVYRAYVDQLVRFPGGGTAQRFHLAPDGLGPRWGMDQAVPRFSHSGLLAFAARALGEVVQLATQFEPHPDMVRVFTPEEGL